MLHTNTKKINTLRRPKKSQKNSFVVAWIFSISHFSMAKKTRLNEGRLKVCEGPATKKEFFGDFPNIKIFI